MLNVLSFSDPSGLAAAAGQRFVRWFSECKPGRPIGVALSGGRIARSFYEAIVLELRNQPCDLSPLHFFWADERCVPPDDKESSYAIARDHLFTPLNVPSQNIHRILGEVDPAFAASQAEAEICRVLPLTASGQPQLDLVVLGMGEDGHIASLFPEEAPGLMEDPRVYRPVVATKPPPQRVTLGYPAIVAAIEVWVLASGEGKAAAFQRFQQGDRSMPISRLAHRRSQMVIFEDFSTPKIV